MIYDRKMDKLDFAKMKTCSAKDMINRIKKKQVTNWRNTCKTHIW